MFTLSITTETPIAETAMEVLQFFGPASNTRSTGDGKGRTTVTWDVTDATSAVAMTLSVQNMGAVLNYGDYTLTSAPLPSTQPRLERVA